MADIECFMVERIHKGLTSDDEPFYDVRRVDTGEIIKTNVEWMSGLPVGAMYWTGHEGRSSADHLSVVTPGGTWCIDCPVNGGGRWTREGSPPHVTVSPSILIASGSSSEYHGWLRNGVLRDVNAGDT